MSHTLSRAQQVCRIPGASFVAGYPRSGISLIQTILANCFGLCNASVYDETSVGQSYLETIKAISPEVAPRECFEIIQKQGALVFKTHGGPEEVEPKKAIVIVRDGRRVMCSAKKFHKEALDVEVSMTDMIEGRGCWGSWSMWVRTWAGYSPRGSLWLRYEDVLANLPLAISRIAEHLGIAPVGSELPSFDSLHKIRPEMWRAGATEGNGGMTVEEENNFWHLHGRVMTMLGYYKGQENEQSDIDCAGRI